MKMRTSNFIKGSWKQAAEGRTFPTYNPSTGEILANVARSNASDVDEAVAGGRAALQAWDQVPSHRRGNLMVTFASILQSREDEIAEFICREHGKTLADAHGDVQETVHVALYYAGEGRRQFGTVIPSEKLGKQGFAMRRPFGVVLALTPWNFPFTKVALKIFAALILGNTVVLKPAHETPLIAALLVELMEEAGFPPGVINLVQGRSEDIGDYMVGHTGIDMITYTGSTSVGRKIAAAAGYNLTPVSLELSAKNAMIIANDANLDLALDWAVLCAYATNGQRETAAGRIILLDGIAEEFTRRFVERVGKDVTIGDPLRDDSYMGPLISAEQVQAADEYVRMCTGHGGRILHGGRRPHVDGREGGYFFQPTVIEGVAPNSEPAREETMAPVALLFRVGDLDQAVALANSTNYGLSMAVFSRNIDVAMSIANSFESGVAWINAGTCGAEVGLQFGGVKDTGMGTSEWGPAALDTFSQWKTTYINYSGQHRFVFEDTKLDIAAS